MIGAITLPRSRQLRTCFDELAPQVTSGIEVLVDIGLQPLHLLLKAHHVRMSRAIQRFRAGILRCAASSGDPMN